MRFGKATIMKEIGDGVYGQVFADGDDAVKVFLKDKDITGSSIWKELDILKKLRGCPHVVQMKEVVETKNLRGINHKRYDPYAIKFEKAYCNLFHQISSKRQYTQGQLMNIIVQILLGLESMHRLRIMHRDMKPENVLDFRDGTIKICDFGMSHYPCEQEEDSSDVLTPWYRAPEIAFGEVKYDFNCDVWSVGCIFYECFTKRPLVNTVRDPSEEQILKTILTSIPDDECVERFTQKFGKKPPKCIHKIDDLVIDDDLKDLMKSMLTIDPKKRFSIFDCLEHPTFDRYGLREFITEARAQHPVDVPAILRPVSTLPQRFWDSANEKRILFHGTYLASRINYDLPEEKLFLYCCYLQHKNLHIHDRRMEKLDTFARLWKFDCSPNTQEFYDFEKYMIQTFPEPLYFRTFFEFPSRVQEEDKIRELFSLMLNPNNFGQSMVDLYISWKHQE